jgi:hypothetical protein
VSFTGTRRWAQAHPHRIIALAVLAGLVFLVWGSAQASAAWLIEETPPTETKDSGLWDVSCPTATACIAVGTKTGGAIAETWNGTKWSLQTLATPEGGSNLTLYGVSCTSSSACTAVGSYVVLGVTQPLVERWNGSAWSLQVATAIGGSTSTKLTKVSCASASFCMAVGRYTKSGSKPYSSLWNGAEWTNWLMPEVGGKTTYMESISCPATTDCIAAGSYQKGASEEAVAAEYWNGSEWSVMTISASGSPSRLNDVDCRHEMEEEEEQACLATGFYTSGSSTKPLAEIFTPETLAWTQQTLPTPAGLVSGTLTGAHCVAVVFCIAVGYYENTLGTQVTLGEIWNPSMAEKWTIQPTQNVSGKDTYLQSISCKEIWQCTAVGSAGSEGNSAVLVERTK